MKTVEKMAIGILPGDKVTINQEQVKVEKVTYDNENVYVSGMWGIIGLPKHQRVVIQY